MFEQERILLLYSNHCCFVQLRLGDTQIKSGQKCASLIPVTHTHTQTYIKLASTDTKNRVFLHVMWQIIWQNLKLMLQYPWAKWVLPVNLRPIAEMSSAPSNGASMSDINQWSRVFYHKPSSNGKELNKEIQRPKKQKRKKYKSKIFQGQCGLSKHLPTHFKKQYKQSIWRFQRQKFQTWISDC